LKLPKNALKELKNFYDRTISYLGEYRADGNYWNKIIQVAIITKYVCDLCGRINIDGEEYQNQVILVGNQATERKWKVCENCLGLARDYILDLIDKNQEND